MKLCSIQWNRKEAMKHIPKKTELYKLQDRFKISVDEMEHRMTLQRKEHDKPISTAGELMYDAIDFVMKGLGIDITQKPEIIHKQQEDLGILVWNEEREELAGLMGHYIHTGGKKYIPHSWVGIPYLASDGLCYVDIHDFKRGILTRYGGVKVLVGV